MLWQLFDTSATLAGSLNGVPCGHPDECVVGPGSGAGMVFMLPILGLVDVAGSLGVPTESLFPPR